MAIDVVIASGHGYRLSLKAVQWLRDRHKVELKDTITSYWLASTAPEECLRHNSLLVRCVRALRSGAGHKERGWECNLRVVTLSAQGVYRIEQRRHAQVYEEVILEPCSMLWVHAGAHGKVTTKDTVTTSLPICTEFNMRTRIRIASTHTTIAEVKTTDEERANEEAFLYNSLDRIHACEGKLALENIPNTYRGSFHRYDISFAQQLALLPIGEGNIFGDYITSNRKLNPTSNECFTIGGIRMFIIGVFRGEKSFQTGFKQPLSVDSISDIERKEQAILMLAPRLLETVQAYRLEGHALLASQVVLTALGALLNLHLSMPTVEDAVSAVMAYVDEITWDASPNRFMGLSGKTTNARTGRVGSGGVREFGRRMYIALLEKESESGKQIRSLD